jgi:hypothetical protein
MPMPTAVTQAMAAAMAATRARSKTAGASAEKTDIGQEVYKSSRTKCPRRS